MGDIRKLLDSIYLGDRFCENVIFRENKILFQINCISRLKEGTNEWNYFSERDIEHGYLVFDEVINYNSNRELPLNDEIYKIDIVEKTNEIYSFIIYGCNISDDAISTDISLQIKAKKFYIFNPHNNCIITE